MKPEYVTEEFLKRFIEQAIKEDIGEGDHSSLSTIPEKLEGKANLIIKEDGIIAGLELAEEIFRQIQEKDRQVKALKQEIRMLHQSLETIG